MMIYEGKVIPGRGVGSNNVSASPTVVSRVKFGRNATRQPIAKPERWPPSASALAERPLLAKRT